MKLSISLIIVLFILSACGGLYSGKVAALYWSRTYMVENWQQNEHEDWDMPSEAEFVAKTSRAHGKHVCGGHYVSSKVNGKNVSTYVTDYCTTYDDWYTYKIWEWTQVRTIVADGDFTIQPHWPDDYTLASSERLGGQAEQYNVIAVVEGAQYIISIPLSKWSELSIGTNVQVRFNGFGHASGVE